MQDHSHKFIFLALTGAMCAASLYGSQAGPSLFLSDTRPVFAVAEALMTSGGPHGFAHAAPFSQVGFTAEAAQLNEETPTDDVVPPTDTAVSKPSTATVVPNKSSCPAADASALVSPPTVNGAIGSPTPLETAAPSAQIATDAVLGTGSSCPPVRHDTHMAPKAPLPGAISPNPRADNALPQAVAHP
jgi:hypothetical protein